jgi:lysophospholipase L1-like esterase
MTGKAKFFSLVVLIIALTCFVAIDVIAAPASMPVISRNCPAYASSDVAANANDSSYNTCWKGTTPGWIAYDLSGVPTAQRAQVIAAWYNADTYDYDYTIKSTGTYGTCKSYTVEGNAASGGGSAPTSGWTVLATVSNNVYKSRQHVVNLSGYNWIRLNVSAAGNQNGNSVSINFDVHNASSGVQDDWIFYGDSITAGGMGVNGNGNGCFGQLINAKNSSYFPAAEGAGIGGLLSKDGVQYINTWLPLFPGRYCAVAYGTNDAWGNQAGTTTFYNNMETIVKAIIAAGKIPVVSKIPFSKLADVANNAPNYNAQIDKLYTAYSQIIKGPDFWTYFQNNQGYIGSDGVHPTTDGYVALRQQWADVAYANVYTGAVETPAPTASPTSAPSCPCSLGDVNCSGGSVVDIVDALLIAQYYVGLNPSGFYTCAADVNRDGAIDIVDALRLAQCYVGLISCSF